MVARTCVDLAADADNRLAKSGANDRAVLGLVAHNLVDAVLDVFSVCFGPGSWEGAQGLKLVACSPP
jgi:hypothetical protein